MSNPSVFQASTTDTGSYQLTFTVPSLSLVRSIIKEWVESTSKTLGAFSTVLPLLLVISTLLAAVLLRPLRGGGVGGEEAAAAAADSFNKKKAAGTGAGSYPEKEVKSFKSHKPRPSSPFENVDLPSPKWWIVSLLNVVLTGLFLMSIFLFFSDSIYSHYAPLIWSGCIAYFLGFFGISFVDTKELKHSPSTYGLSDLVGGGVGVGGGSGKKISGSQKISEVDQVDHSIHPVCPKPSMASSPSTPNLINPNPQSNQSNLIRSMSNPEVAGMVLGGEIKDHMLEKTLGDYERAVNVRRMVFSSKLPPSSLSDLPSGPSLDYSKVFGANCEIVVGYVPIPVGMCGPLTLNNEKVFIPMATTEGCLVASTNRGCKAITVSGGCKSYLLKDGITRAPCLECEGVGEAAR